MGRYVSGRIYRPLAVRPAWAPADELPTARDTFLVGRPYASRAVFNSTPLGVNPTLFGPPQVRPVGVHRTWLQCGESNEVMIGMKKARKAPTKKVFHAFFRINSGTRC